MKYGYCLLLLGLLSIVAVTAQVACGGSEFTAGQGGAGGSTSSSGMAGHGTSSSSSGGSTSSSSTSSSSTSTTSSTSTASSSSGGGSGGGCPSLEKFCGGQCVAQNDPVFGCDPAACLPPCSLDHAIATCSAGACAIQSCAPNYDDCNMTPADGCEVNLKADANHCGTCNVACNLPNAIGSCDNGACAIASCVQDYKDCNGQPDDGCEIDLMTDPVNCKTCGHICMYSHAACDQGTCAGPCGDIPLVGIQACVVYGKAVPGATDHVGLKGGVNQLPDPWSGCVNPVAGKKFVLCDFGNPPANADIELRAGLHASVAAGTTAGTFDCGNLDCTSSVYIYDNAVEISKLEGNVASNGILSEVTDPTPPNYKNIKVTLP